MASILKFLMNPAFYRRLPIPIVTITSLGLLSYYINMNKDRLMPMLQNIFVHQENHNDLSVITPPRVNFSDKETTIHPKKTLVIPSNGIFFNEVLRYIYIKYSENIDKFNYSEEKIYHFNEWRYRRKEKPKDLKIIKPFECAFDVAYKGKDMNISFEIVKDSNGDLVKLMECHDCCSEEKILMKIELQAESKDLLIEFVDESKDYIKKEEKSIKSASKETMCIYYYKKDYWTLLSKCPKRPSSTIYLKKGKQEELMDCVTKFFSKETRDIYLSFGIPYKSINLIYGPPGTGKTSVIKAVASDLDCDLYVLPITKDMLDTNLVDAFSYISDNETKERIIVIEDIDTMFDDRKKGDKENGITLQGFLNCLDGFTCVEGTMLFVTANKPEVLDYAMLRSCRIDHKLRLDYADRYQTEKMFHTFLPNQSKRFNEFYNEIRHREFTTAMLQEFLFYNRDCENIIKIIDKFIEIVEKNDPKNFEILKEENKNFYS